MREALDQMDFVIAAYAVGVLGTVVMIVWSLAVMRRAEARREEARRK